MANLHLSPSPHSLTFLLDLDLTPRPQSYFATINPTMATMTTISPLYYLRFFLVTTCIPLY